MGPAITWGLLYTGALKGFDFQFAKTSLAPVGSKEGPQGLQELEERGGNRRLGTKEELSSLYKPVPSC